MNEFDFVHSINLVCFVSFLSSIRSIEKKIEVLKEWFELDPEYDDYAGCLLLGYEAFMKIVNYSASKNCTRLPSEAKLIEKNVKKYLLKPGEITALYAFISYRTN